MAADPDTTPTEFVPTPSSVAAAPAPAMEDERFLPGAVLARRYRIIGPLGRGGMGEVYRATDLLLRQEVALKFLTGELSSHRDLLERFLNEVRTARQVSHPNICRVYDVGEYDGHRYISMEYVDGEDLGSLLRRIGRLPADKATEIARRLCAGLAAAHERGILHRDLKPANIMIDSRGQVLIMDFGLAGLAGHFLGAEIRNGTPAYMAPEQLAGREVTARSDIYSLGLVLYEMFTGRPAFEAATVAELMRLQRQATPIGPATMVRDMDPSTERVILRCLEPDPARRPASALAVAAALPGSDPLAAALAAGETPSPDMVAAAGETAEAVRPLTALLAFAAVLLGLGACAIISSRVAIIGRMPLQNSPDALGVKAREILASAGHSEKPVGVANSFAYNRDYLRWVAANPGNPAAGHGDAVRFWYRTSPHRLMTFSFFGQLPVPGIVSEFDPPMKVAGMTEVWTDSNGRLESLEIVTPPGENPPGQAREVDWRPLLAAAGRDATLLAPAEPRSLPQTSWDTRAAWTGPSGVRVEAAAFRGKPVFFKVIQPWTIASIKDELRDTAGERAANLITIALLLAAAGWGCAMARRNVRLRRGDPRGASRLAALTLTCMFFGWVLAGDHVPEVGEIALAIMAVSWGLFFAALACVHYMALEPYARRHWPRTLISWTRLLSGNVRDPLVAKHVLFGAAAGIAFAIVAFARHAATLDPDRAGLSVNLRTLLGLRHLSSMVLIQAAIAVAVSLMLLFLLLGLRALLRKQWIACVAFVAILIAPDVLRSDKPVLAGALAAVTIGLALVILLRFGLLSLVASNVVANAVHTTPLTVDTSSWYFGLSLFLLVAVAAFAAYAFRVALAGRPVFLHD